MIMIFINEPIIEMKPTYLWLSNDYEYIVYTYVFRLHLHIYDSLMILNIDYMYTNTNRFFI